MHEEEKPELKPGNTDGFSGAENGGNTENAPAAGTAPSEPPSRAMKYSKARLIALFVCVAVALASLAYIGVYAVASVIHKRDSDEIKNIYKNAVRTPAPAESANPAPSGSPGPEGEETSPPPSPEGPTEEELLIQAETEGRELFSELLDINGDFWGFVKIEGLDIEEPFVWSDSNEKYLNTNFKGNRSDHGTVFLDFRNHPYLTNYNNVFYGHNMHDGTMFSSLIKYKTISNYEKAPVIEIDSLTGVTTWLIFAAYTCEPNYGYINTWVSGDEYAELLEEIYLRSLFHTNIDVNEDDRIITLSTCNTYEFRDTRFVVHARKLREGEELPGEFVAEKNENQKPINVPNQLKLADLDANKTAVMQQPRSLKHYYYQATENGVVWYIGDTKLIQGPYSAYANKLTDNYTGLSVIPSADVKTFYMAGSGFGAKPGIYLLSAHYLVNTFRFVKEEPVTPAGVDARWAVLSLDPDGALWLLYMVEEEGQESIYRMRAVGGTPQKVATVLGTPGLRPVSMSWVNGEAICIWKEVNNLRYRAARIRPSSGEFVILDRALTLETDCERMVMYGIGADSVAKVMIEKEGLLSPNSSYDLRNVWVLPLPEEPVVATPEPVETPAPTESPVETETPAAETAPPAATEPPEATEPPPADTNPVPPDTQNDAAGEGESPQQ